MAKLATAVLATGVAGRAIAVTGNVSICRAVAAVLLVLVLCGNGFTLGGSMTILAAAIGV
jgi:hypothetical protein